MRYDGVCDINNYSGCGDYDRYWILSHAMKIVFMDKMMVATIVTLISDKVAFFLWWLQLLYGGELIGIIIII